MLEICYCGRTGDISDRLPTVIDEGQRALRCPDESCGHLDSLGWLPEDARQDVFEEAGFEPDRIVA